MVETTVFISEEDDAFFEISFENIVYQTVLLFITTLLYIYGLIKWTQFQSHLIITKRFPWVSNGIILFAYLQIATGVSNKWIKYYDHVANNAYFKFLYYFGPASAFVIAGLIIFRVILIYLRWKKVQQTIKRVLDVKSLKEFPSIQHSLNHHTKTKPLTKKLDVDIIYEKEENTQTTPQSPVSTDGMLDAKTVISIPDESNLDFSSATAATQRQTQSKPLRQSALNKAFLRQNHTVYKHPLSILWLMYLSVMFCVFISSSWYEYPPGIIPGLGFTLEILVGLISVIYVLCKKVKDGIGCLHETWFTLCWLMVAFPLTFLPKTSIAIIPAILATLGPIQGLLSIYLSLYYIYKCEGSLNVKIWKEKYLKQIYRNNTHSANESTNTIFSDEINNQKNNNDERVVEIDLNVPCLIFLNDYSNYKIFASYLAHCFALENLLFFEKASVYYQLVKKYRQKARNEKISSLSVPNDDNKTLNSKQRIQRVKFLYSHQMYEDYDNKIKQKMDNKQNDILRYKKALYNICRSIYDEFIAVGSINEINLSFDTRNSLQFLLQNKENMKKFQTWEDFMYLWDDSLVEVCRLLLSSYQYKFKQYVENNSM